MSAIGLFSRAESDRLLLVLRRCGYVVRHSLGARVPQRRSYVESILDPIARALRRGSRERLMNHLI